MKCKNGQRRKIRPDMPLWWWYGRDNKYGTFNILKKAAKTEQAETRKATFRGKNRRGQRERKDYENET